MSVFVAQGDTVTAGQAIARIDPLDMALSETSARTQLAAAQAELDFNEADFRRFQELHQKGSFPALRLTGVVHSSLLLAHGLKRRQINWGTSHFVRLSPGELPRCWSSRVRQSRHDRLQRSFH